MDLTEVEDINKRWQEYTEELYKKDFHDTDGHNGVIANLEPDILACEIKWALGSITTNKTSLGDEIPDEQFLIFPCYSLELCIQMGISFLFSFAFGFSSFLSNL